MDEILMWFTPEQAQSLGSSDPVVRAMIDVYVARHHKREREAFGREVLADLDALDLTTPEYDIGPVS